MNKNTKLKLLLSNKSQFLHLFYKLKVLILTNFGKMTRRNIKFSIESAFSMERI